MNHCRTCYNNGENFHSMDEYSTDHGQKTLADMLLAVAKVDATDKNDKTLPRHMCSDCRSKLEMAFSFAHKSQNINKRLLLTLKPAQYREDCLTESLIDFPLQNDWQVKIEKDLEANISDLEGIFDDISLPQSDNAGKSNEAEEKIMEVSQTENDPIMDCQSSETETNTRRQSKGVKKLQSGRFSCDVCLKTFAWKKDVQRHALTHTSSPRYNCSYCERQFLRKDKLKDHMKVHEKQLANKLKSPQPSVWNLAGRLYGSSVLQVQCKLCDADIKDLPQLRQHLMQHSNPMTLDSLTTSCEVMQWFKDEQDFEQVKEIICRDIKQQNLARYCSIVNEHGYEVALSDAEVAEFNYQFTCELCLACFEQDYQIMEHAKSVHLADVYPHKCHVCQLPFVCQNMYELHLSSHCKNADKLYKCEKCLAKFMWFENLQGHKCCEFKERNIACYLCSGNFSKLAELRAHLEAHASLELPVQLKDSEYYKVYGEHFQQQSEESIVAHILEELSSGNKLWQFYNATDKLGNELDIDDSESDDNVEKIYKCSICPVENDYHQRKFLLQHQKIAHSAWKSLPFQCDACEEQFIADALLERHKKRDCQQDRKKDFTCKKCSVGFVWQKNLEVHLKMCKISKTVKLEKKGSKLKCEQCEKVFIWPKDLIRHKLIHLPEHKKIQCPHCERRFNRNDNLRRHLRVHTEKSVDAVAKEEAAKNLKAPSLEVKEPKIECKECGRKFSLKRDLARHSVMHTRDAAIHKCLWCGRKFYNKNNLLMHIQRHGILADQWEAARCIVTVKSQPHGVKRMQCKICRSHDFRSISALRVHVEQELVSSEVAKNADICGKYSITNSVGCELDINDSETDEECDSEMSNKTFFYVCEICGIKCRRKYEVMQHQLTLHKWENLPHKCEKCIFRTVCKEILVNHMQTQCFNQQKQYACEMCSYRFGWPENLEEHKLKMHVNTEVVVKDATSHEGNLEPTNTGSLTFECNNCHDKFNRKKTLALHMQKKHGAANKAVDTEESTTAKFLCAFCGRALSSSSNLIIHMRRHTGEKPFKCKFCEKAFPRSSDMVCHQRTHTGERPHKCTVCHKAFSRMYKLRTHMRIHSGERPYKCTFCEKSFTQSNDLALHIRRHTGERPYVCGICGERFIQSTALKNHRNLKSHFEDNVPPRGNYLERIDTNNACNY